MHRRRRDIQRRCTVVSLACQESTSREFADFAHAAETEHWLHVPNQERPANSALIHNQRACGRALHRPISACEEILGHTVFRGLATGSLLNCGFFPEKSATPRHSETA
jgi:hypothetical protein